MLASARASHWPQVFEALETDREGAREADGGGATALHWACLKGAPRDLVERLWDAHPEAAERRTRAGGATPPMFAGATVLHLAVRGKAGLDVVQLICERSPDTARARNDNGQLALHIAMCFHNQDVDLLKLLLKHNGDAVAAEDATQHLPLHNAAYHGAAPEVVRELLARYPDGARHKDHSGCLPLHDSVLGGKAAPAVVEMLLATYPAGASARNRQGRVPGSYARTRALRLLLPRPRLVPPAALLAALALALALLALHRLWLNGATR